MELVKLTQTNINNNVVLKKFLNTKPRHKKIVTLTPNKEIFNRLKDIVEETVGDNKMSKIISWMVDNWVDHINPTNPPKKYDTDIHKTTLNVDQDLWERFENKIYNKFARYRMQSDVINEIIDKYLSKHYK